MRTLLLVLSLVLFSGCAITPSESDMYAYFDAQKGRSLPEASIRGYRTVVIREGLVEFVPPQLPKSGWAIVWLVDTRPLSVDREVNDAKHVGVIVSWRILGDKNKVRIPVTYKAG